jgi:hypothetical protein
MKNKFLKTKTMCKNNWNSLNFDYKNLANFHRRTCNHVSFWELSFEKKRKIHLPHQFNKKCYELIKAFQREKAFNAHVHTKDGNIKGDRSYTP